MKLVAIDSALAGRRVLAFRELPLLAQARALPPRQPTGAQPPADPWPRSSI